MRRAEIARLDVAGRTAVLGERGPRALRDDRRQLDARELVEPDAADRHIAGRARRGGYREGDQRDECEERPPHAALSHVEGGSSTPFAASFCTKLGRSAVERSGLEQRRPASRAELGGSSDEQILERDDVALHAGDLGDLRDAAGAVDEPSDMNEEVEAARDLLADRLHRQFDPGHQHEHLEPVDGVTGRVRVDRCQRSVVAGVHRLEHVERLGTANLSDDDPVGPHPECVANEIANAHLALAFHVRRARLERDDVPLE